MSELSPAQQSDIRDLRRERDEARAEAKTKHDLAIDYRNALDEARRKAQLSDDAHSATAVRLNEARAELSETRLDTHALRIARAERDEARAACAALKGAAIQTLDWLEVTHENGGNDWADSKAAECADALEEALSNKPLGSELLARLESFEEECARRYQHEQELLARLERAERERDEAQHTFRDVEGSEQYLALLARLERAESYAITLQRTIEALAKNRQLPPQELSPHIIGLAGSVIDERVALKARLEKAEADAKQCHSRNDELVTERFQFKAQLETMRAALEATEHGSCDGCSQEGSYCYVCKAPRFDTTEDPVFPDEDGGVGVYPRHPHEPDCIVGRALKSSEPEGGT